MPARVRWPNLPIAPWSASRARPATPKGGRCTSAGNRGRPPASQLRQSTYRRVDKRPSSANPEHVNRRSDVVATLPDERQIADVADVFGLLSDPGRLRLLV